MRLGSAMTARGFTLVELMIGVVIFSLLALLAAPMYGDFMGNTQVRTAAESIVTGIRLAQSEAVRRGIPVRFELIGTAPATGWQVVFLADDMLMPNCGATTNCISDNRIAGTCNPGEQCVVRSYDFSSGAPYASAVPDNLNGVVTFNSLGMPASLNPDGSSPLTKVVIDNSHYASARELWVLVGGLTSSAAGGTRMCDHTLPTGDPMACT